MRPIYLVVTPFFPEPGRHYGVYCYDFVRALERMGKYDVRVFVPGAGEDYVYQGVLVHRFRTRQLPSAIFPFLFDVWNQRSFLRKLKVCGIDLKGVMVCHGHTALFGVYPLSVRARNPNCLAVLHHHDLASFGLRLGRLRHVWLHKVINFLLLRRLHEALDLHVFISAAVERSFRLFPRTDWSVYEDYRRVGRGLKWFRPARIGDAVVLWNGVDLRHFTPKARATSDNFVIGCVSNFLENKGHLDLLNALLSLIDRIQGIKVRLIGIGPTLGTCRAFVREHGLEANVSFEEEMDHTQLPDFYRSLDLFVLPSYFEGFGCVFTEAWACGTPFITCEGQGMDDMVVPEERHLWLCKPKCPEDLADKILYFYRHRPAQHLAGPIDIDVLVSRFVGQIEALRKGKGNG